MAGLSSKRWVRVANGAMCFAVLSGGIAAAAVHEDEERGPCGPTKPMEPAEVLDCLADDIAHITTPIGAGSAVLLPDGRLLTNAHVVDPFAAVDVGFRDGTTVEDVPVIGVDLQRDLAVLGPIERRSDVVLADAETIQGLVQGDALFLIGYPGDIEETTLEPTISQGILSRQRVAERFGDLNYLQTDASIGGGQSGGALVDATGHVIGISGLSFADNFALALSAPDVAAGLAAIDEGDGSPYQPTGVGAVASGSFHHDAGAPPHFLSWAPAAADQTVRMELSTGLGAYMEVRTFQGELLWAPRVVLESEDWQMLGIDEATRDLLLGRVGHDLHIADFVIPAEDMAIATILPFSENGTDVTFTSSVPVTDHADADDGTVIEPGYRTEGTIGAFELMDTYRINLAEGQAIEVYVGAVAADMAYAVYGEGGEADDTNIIDDSDEGFYGLDAHDTFTAPAAGTYTIEVGTFDPYSLGYVLEVLPA